MIHRCLLVCCMVGFFAPVTAVAQETGSAAVPREILSRAETSEEYNRSINKLQVVLPELKFKDAGPEQVLAFIQSAVKMPFKIDRDALRAVAGAKISISVKKVTASQALKLVLDRWGKGTLDIGCYVSHGTVRITSRRAMAGVSLIRTYDVGDLIPVGSQESDSALQPPTKMQIEDDPISVDDAEPSRGLFSRMGRNARDTGEGKGVEPVVVLVMEMVAPTTWGRSAAVLPVGSMLVVDQSPENHDRISSLLALVRKQYESSGLLANMKVHARWLRLDRKRVLAMQKRTGGQPPVIDAKTVDAAVIEYEAMTQCRSGQKVRIVSGEAESVVITTAPIVTEKVVTQRPVVKMVQWGATAEMIVRYRKKTDSVRVEMDSVICEPIGSREKRKLVSGETIDRLRFTVRTLKAAAAIPVGKPVILGCMTGGKQIGDQMLCLVLQVDREK